MAGPTAVITWANILSGPGVFYYGVQGTSTAAPAASAVNAAPAASAWAQTGATDGGLTLNMNQTHFIMEVDQVPDPVGTRLTSRQIRLATSLAEATLDNMAMAMNESPSASAITAGAGYEQYAITPGQSIMFPYETAIMFDGHGPGTAKRRRVVCKRVTSIENVGTAYQKGALTLVPVTFLALYIDETTSPLIIQDEI